IRDGQFADPDDRIVDTQVRYMDGRPARWTAPPARHAYDVSSAVPDSGDPAHPEAAAPDPATHVATAAEADPDEPWSVDSASHPASPFYPAGHRPERLPVAEGTMPRPDEQPFFDEEPSAFRSFDSFDGPVASRPDRSNRLWKARLGAAVAVGILACRGSLAGQLFCAPPPPRPTSYPP